MKKIICLIVGVMVILFSGCAAMFGNEAQYEKGDWYFLTGPDEVAKMKQDKLAIEKLEEQPVQTTTINGVPRGFKGLVANLSRYSRINIIINGPEKKRYLLATGQTQDDYLIPGDYIATAYKGNTQIGKSWSFEVNAQQYNYMGRAVHWYIYYED